MKFEQNSQSICILLISFSQNLVRSNFHYTVLSRPFKSVKHTKYYIFIIDAFLRCFSTFLGLQQNIAIKRSTYLCFGFINFDLNDLR